jgi:polar amino acid transport system substrate-binding protein
MKKRIATLLVAALCCVAFKANAAPMADQGKLRVAVSERPPYSFRDEDAKWTGLGISLWEKIAGRLGLSFEYVEVPFAEIPGKLASGECDLTPNLPLSGDRSDLIRYTEPYLLSHGVLLTRRECVMREMLNLTKQLINRQMLLIIALMLAGMLLFSLILLVVERRRLNGHFSGSGLKNFGSALWFSASTMTTVGYGDTSPLSPLSRVVTFLWMLFGVLVIAIFTGSVSSSLTMADITSGIIHLNEFNRFDVGVIKGSRMEELMESRGIPSSKYDSLEAGLDALRSRKSISAFAGDDLTIGYAISRRHAGEFHMSLVPTAEVLLAFASRPGLPSLEAINANLMQITLSPDWHARCERWTGPSGF